MPDDRKKRAEATTVPRMKAREAAKPPTARPPRASRPAKGRLVEELGERVRRDPRRESD